LNRYGSFPSSVRCPSGGITDTQLDEGGVVAGDEDAAGAVALIKIAFRGFQQGVFCAESGMSAALDFLMLFS
jgi:hypothetical protein